MNAAKFSQVVEQYQKLVYTICFQMVRDHHTAEDLAQETFLSAYSHIDRCPEESLRPWLARIATNKAKDYLKSAYNRRVTATEDSSLPEAPPPGAHTPPGPEDLAVTADELQAIQSMVHGLREPYRMVSELYFLEEKSVDEIALQLHRPPKTVHTQLYRARRLLQQQILERSVQN